METIQYNGPMVIGCTIEPPVRLLTPGACLAMQTRTGKARRKATVGAAVAENYRLSLSPNRFCRESCPNWGRGEKDLITRQKAEQTAQGAPMEKQKPELDLIKTGRWIRDLRIKLGLSQVELAEKLGISAGHLSNFEGGRRKSVGDYLSQLRELEANHNHKSEMEQHRMTDHDPKDEQRQPAQAKPTPTKAQAELAKMTPECLVVNLGDWPDLREELRSEAKKRYLDPTDYARVLIAQGLGLINGPAARVD